MKKKDILLLGALAAAAFTLYKAVKKKSGKQRQVPSAAAPQTPINNPGDQSDFPAPPVTDEGLRH